MKNPGADLAITRLRLTASPNIDPRQVRGFVYRALRSEHPGIHDEAVARPFTTAVLRSPSRGTTIVVSTIGSAITEALVRAVRDAETAGSGLVSAQDEVRSVDVDGSSWDRIMEAPATHEVRVRFLSPVVFRRRGVHYPLPEPVLVFGSLVAAWNTFSPRPCPSEIADRLQHAVTPKELNLRSVAVATHEVVRGAVGSVTYHLRRASDEERAWLGRIAAFAPFSGVGARTTAGFGHVAVERSP